MPLVREALHELGPEDALVQGDRPVGTCDDQPRCKMILATQKV